VLPSNKLVIEAAYASWAARDLDAVMASFAEDVTFIIHLPTDVVPYAGEVRGRAELLRRFKLLLNDFDFLSYQPVQIVDRADSFHSLVRFHYRHVATGLEYEGTMRHTWKVEGDQIVRFEEFHDTERVRSFFRLLAQAQTVLQLRKDPMSE